MATSLDEQIMDLIVSKLENITTGNGYEQTVPAANIHRPPVGVQEFEVSDCPALVVRKAGKTVRFHLRGAEEVILEVDILCIVEAASEDSNEEISDLMNDVKKLVYANEFWNNGSANLARRTWINGDVPHEVEQVESKLTGRVSFMVLARADRTNPYVTKAI